MVIVSVFLILKTCVEYGFVVGVPSSLILYSLRGYPFITCYNFLIFSKIDMLTRYFFTLVWFIFLFGGSSIFRETLGVTKNE